MPAGRGRTRTSLETGRHSIPHQTTRRNPTPAARQGLGMLTCQRALGPLSQPKTLPAHRRSSQTPAQPRGRRCCRLWVAAVSPERQWSSQRAVLLLLPPPAAAAVAGSDRAHGRWQDGPGPAQAQACRLTRYPSPASHQCSSPRHRCGWLNLLPHRPEGTSGHRQTRARPWTAAPGCVRKNETRHQARDGPDPAPRLEIGRSRQKGLLRRVLGALREARPGHQTDLSPARRSALRHQRAMRKDHRRRRGRPPQRTHPPLRLLRCESCTNPRSHDHPGQCALSAQARARPGSWWPR